MFEGHNASGRRPGRRPNSVVKLSPAEADVVAGVAQGLSNKEIAARRGRSVSTVKGQLVSVYRKLGVRSRIRLMVLFRP